MIDDVRAKARAKAKMEEESEPVFDANGIDLDDFQISDDDDDLPPPPPMPKSPPARYVCPFLPPHLPFLTSST